MQIKCPNCGAECEAECELTVGQHVICPYCQYKFAYLGFVQGIAPLLFKAKKAATAVKDKVLTIWRNSKDGRYAFVAKVKMMANVVRNKTVSLWKIGWNGKVILCVAALLTPWLIWPSGKGDAEAKREEAETQREAKVTAELKSAIKQGATAEGRTMASKTSVSVHQAWDMEALRKTYSRPMSPDQEIYNNLLYLYLSMKGNYDQYKKIKTRVFDFDHTGLSAEMKDFTVRFVSLLDKIGEIERKAVNSQRDGELERSDASVSSGFEGGLTTASTLSQIDDGNIGIGTYISAGLIGGCIESSRNDSRIKEKYERIAREYYEQEESLYLGFKQEINKLRNSEMFSTFDKQRLLPEDVIGTLSIVRDSDKYPQIGQCKVPELRNKTLSYAFDEKDREQQIIKLKQFWIDCIASYPQSLKPTKKADVANWYKELGEVVFIQNLGNFLRRKSRGEDLNEQNINRTLDAMLPSDWATITTDSIDILSEGLKHDSDNTDIFKSRADLKYVSGDNMGAIADIDNAIRISPKGLYFYSKACILAKGLGDPQGAKIAIRGAFQKGFCDIKKLKSDDDLAILRNDPEFMEMTKVKTRWWYEEGIFFSKIFLKNESCFRLTNVRLVSSGSWNWNLPTSGTITLEPEQMFSEDWYNNPPSNTQPTAEIFCDQK